MWDHKLSQRINQSINQKCLDFNPSISHWWMVLRAHAIKVFEKYHLHFWCKWIFVHIKIIIIFIRCYWIYKKIKIENGLITKDWLNPLMTCLVCVLQNSAVSIFFTRLSSERIFYTFRYIVVIRMRRRNLIIYFRIRCIWNQRNLYKNKT